MQLSRIACVFGISGVGKTTLLEQFASDNPSWRILAPGKLLAESAHLESEQLRTATRSQIEQNQFAFANLVRQLRIQDPVTNFLLDAHSVIDNDAELVSVPVAAVVKLVPTDLVFVLDDPSEIFLRRRSDQRRRRPTRSIERIAEEQELARRNVLLYSHALGLTMQEVFAADLVRLTGILNSR